MDTCHCGNKLKKRKGRVVKFCSIGCRRSAQSVIKKCLSCKSDFKVGKSRAEKAKYCSNSCHAEAQRVYPVEVRMCHECGKPVKITKDNRSSEKVFCNKECLNKSRNMIKTIKCKSCLKVFSSRFRHGKSYSQYCSVECRSDDGTDTITCDNCGSKRKKPLSHIRGELNFCSSKCRGELLSGKNSPRFNQEGRAMTNKGVYIARDGDEWRLEHRVLIEKHIGRKLEKNSEPVLHINGDNSDNSLNNLYVCLNFSEMQTILKSYKAPYPVYSNLNEMKRLAANK